MCARDFLVPAIRINIATANSFLSYFALPKLLNMPSLFYIISPILLLISIPLSIFAAVTTTLAFSTLFFRALLVYAELAAALIQDQFVGQPTIKSSASSNTRLVTLATTDGRGAQQKSRRSSVGSSSSNGGSTTPRILEPSGLGIYNGGVAARDFEGVGGWRIPGPDDALWTSMNSRLELPAMADGHQRHHNRSQTTSASSTTTSLHLRSPIRSRTPIRVTGSTSPQEYFANRIQSKSTTTLDAAKIGKALLRRNPSTSSSGSSQAQLAQTIDQQKGNIPEL